jgi:putative pre-16S rRNA nuclease
MSTSRIMAIDPGERRIGVAICDDMRMVARPLLVLEHSSMENDAARIAALAREHGVSLLLVGVALDSEGEVGPQARKGMRLVEALHRYPDFLVETRDESYSSQMAAQARLAQGGPRRKRGPLDATAAAIILQEYLDTLGQAK